jgi:hypothetical protein
LSAFIQIGYFSEDEGLRLSEDLPSLVSSSKLKSSSLPASDRSQYARAIRTQTDSSEAAHLSSAQSHPSVRAVPTPASFLWRTWSLVVLVTAAVGIVAALLMLFYVCAKVKRLFTCEVSIVFL